uniref:Uncharacterized protein n=1 Tax=Panagrolaimus sp. ES5 TaxID=591445 RepID=A0AC34FU98_9BILA
MATKDYCFFAKDNELFSGDNSIDKYSNLNLNQNYPCLNSDTVCAKFVKDESKKFVNEASDDTLQARKNFSSFDKSASKTSSEYLNLGHDFDKKEFKEDGKDSNINSSTLSLHISAYENSIETSSPDSEGFKESKAKNEKLSLVKKWKNVKQILVGAKEIQNPFEFPRQSNNGSEQEPEVMQFKASQKLLKPAEALGEYYGKTDEQEEWEKDFENEEMLGLHHDGDTRIVKFSNGNIQVSKHNIPKPVNSPVPSPTTLSSLLATGFDFVILMDETKADLAKRLIDTIRNYITYEAETAYEENPEAIFVAELQKKICKGVISKMWTKMYELRPEQKWIFWGVVEGAVLMHGNEELMEVNDLALSKKIEINFVKPFKLDVVGFC